MCPEIARTETRDTGQPIAQTGKQLVPRAADNFYYFAEMCTRVDGHTYPTPTHLNYTLYHPVGVCALISPWNVPFMTATWKVAPCARVRQHRGAEDERAVAADARHASASSRSRRGFRPACSTSCTASASDAGEPLCRHPDVRAISFTGSTRHRQPHRPGRGAEEIQHGAGRQEPLRRLRRRRPGARARRGAVHDLLEQRRTLHRRLAHPGRSSRLCRRSRPLRRARPAHPWSAIRSTRRRIDRSDDQPRLTSTRCAATSSSAARKARRCSAAASSRPTCLTRVSARQLRPADRVRRRRQPHARSPRRRSSGRSRA